MCCESRVLSLVGRIESGGRRGRALGFHRSFSGMNYNRHFVGNDDDFDDEYLYDDDDEDEAEYDDAIASHGVCNCSESNTSSQPTHTSLSLSLSLFCSETKTCERDVEAAGARGPSVPSSLCGSRT